MSVEILDRGLVVDDGRLQYAWFRLRDGDSSSRFHAVALRELAAVPLNLRDDPDVLGKQWAAVRGLYNARVNFLYAAAGIFQLAPVGVVQYYGAAGSGASQAEAARDALNQVAAVEGTLANYPQSRLMPPTLRWVEWYLTFLADPRNRFLAILGYPDPRQGRRGLGRDGSLPDQNDDDLAAEQNELLFRGLAKLREDFIFQVTAAHVAQADLTDTLQHVARYASITASRQRGSLSASLSLGIPIMAALSQSVGGGHSAAQSQARSQADGASESWGVSHTDSQSHTTSHAVSVGGAETWGTSDSHSTGVSHGVSAAHTDSAGTAHTDSQGTAHTDSSSASHSSSVSVSDGVSTSSNWSHSAGNTQSVGQSVGSAHTASASDSQSQSASLSQNDGTSHSDSQTWGNAQSLTHSAGTNVGAAAIVSGGYQEGYSGTDSGSWGGGQSDGVSHGSGSALSVGSGHTSGQADTTNSALSVGAAHSASDAVGGGTVTSHSVSTGSTDTVTHGSSDTVSHGTADSTSKGTADSRGTSDAVSTTDTHTTSHSVSNTWGETWGESNTVGSADGQSAAWGRSHQTGDTAGAATGRGGQAAFGGGFSAGFAPALSIGQSFQTEDDAAIRLTEILRGLEGVVNQASLEGGFMTNAFLIAAGERGATAAAALVPHAFHGPNVPTPILTITPDPLDELILREHALAFLPLTDRDPRDPFEGRLGGRYSTLLTAGQLAAYTAPGLFEEGTAQVVTEQLPRGLGFYPDLPGDVTLGHQYSPETADLTSAPVRLDPARAFHTLFAADTGYGKSVAAIRLVYETALRWQMPTVVLDWGAGWRQLLNAPGLAGRVNLYQLWPHAARPLRWNPLQIGRNLPPETQWRAFADIFGAIARMGVKRQKQELLEALRGIYLRAGVLIDDPQVRGDPELGQVRLGEPGPVGLALGDLTPAERQMLAVERSRSVGLGDLYGEIQAKLLRVPPRDTMLTGVLEGILFRLNALVQGAAAQQFAPGPATVAMEDLIQGWGITILEGGSFLDEFGKAFLLGWAGWHLYTDAVARRVHSGATTAWAQIVFEEANKIFGGVPDGGSSEDGAGGAAYTAQQFGHMFRDSRKYGIWLHVIAQSPHLVPEDIISSCNNLLVGFLKNPKDKDLILSALAKSEKGFTDEAWRRFLSDLATGQFICRLGYAKDRYRLRPMLMQPLMLHAPEPDDAAIEAALGRISL